MVRGGSVMSSESDIRSASRKEINYYDNAQPFTSKTMGLRLVLVSQAITSTDRVKLLEKNWSTLGDDKTGAESSKSGSNDTAKALGSLASGVEDGELKKKLKDLENQLRASNQQQQEERAQSIRASLNLGSFSVPNYRTMVVSLTSSITIMSCCAKIKTAAMPTVPSAKISWRNKPIVYSS